MKRFAQAFLAQWRLILSDKAAAILVFGGLIAYSLIFPAPYSAQIARGNPVAVVDLDHSSLSRQLIQTAQASGAVVVSREARSPDEAQALLRDGEIIGFLIIPEDFQRDVLSGKSPAISWGGDAVHYSAYGQIASAFGGAVGNLNAGIRFKKALAAGSGAAGARAGLAPVAYADRPLFNTREGVASYSAPAILVLVMQQTILLAIGLLVGTKRERAAFSSLPREGVPELFGRAAAFASIYSAHTLYLYGFVAWFWDLPIHGNLPMVLLFLQPYFFACAFFGLTLAGLFRRRETALLAIGVLGMPMAYVAGFAWPHEALPSPIRAVSWLLPSTPGIQGALQVMQMGATFAEVLPRWLALWGLVLLYALLARHAKRPQGFYAASTLDPS